MPSSNNAAVEGEIPSAAPASEATQEHVERIRALTEWKTKDLPPQIAADTVMKMLGDMANGTIMNSAAQREVLDVYMRRAIQAEQSEPDSDEAEVWALAKTFDARLTEAEKRIERVLARLGVE